MINRLPQAVSGFASGRLLAVAVVGCAALAGTARHVDASVGINVVFGTVSTSTPLTLRLPGLGGTPFQLQPFLTITSTPTGLSLSMPTADGAVTPYIFSLTTGGTTYANTFSSGQLIPGSGTTAVALTSPEALLNGGAALTSGSTYYIGFDGGLSVGSGTDNYGWIGVSMTSVNTASVQFFAMQSTSGTPVLAGSLNEVAVPEPASLSLLGAGAVGLLARRRTVKA